MRAPILDAASALVGEVRPDADDSRLRAAIDRAAELLAEPRALDRGVPEVERQLFAAAAPAPLATTAFAPMRARRAAAGRADPAPAVPSAASTRWWEPMLAHVDRGIGEMVSDAATSVWRRLRADRPGRRRHPVLLASGVAAGVLAVGLLWPEPGPSSAVAEGTTTAATAHATESGGAARPTPAPSTREKTAAPVDALTAVTALLDARAGCADAACRARSQEDPAAVFPDGAAARAPDERTVSLVDDYGGAAVLRVRAKDGTGPDQLIVAVRTDEEWLLRDVRAVAEQR
ncbi:hypothetical protein [Microbacterium elymi]|uniref:DUF4878 domain-containing protein n=1 Tax=Microbacterium elymi TaxID=2909587 RepID=A0ABY5NJQ7_9MICO|nr:hypothetical protein [Microbacterium elymi]UUT35356.1 hypothetical protein L2X98_35010 [Microbacterium elymi]